MKEGRVYQNIINAYYELRNKLDISMLCDLNVIIIMQPKVFLEFRNELDGLIYGKKYENFICYSIKLCGRQTPIKIDDELPKEVEFIIMTQKDYEIQEKEKLMTTLNKMFQ